MDVKKIESGKIIAFKPRQIEAPNNSKQSQQAPQKSVEPLVFPNNPQYFQAINNINFANQFVAIPSFNSSGAINLLRLHVLFDEDDSVTLDIDRNDSVELFLNKEGKIDNNSLNFFIEYYRQYFQIRKKRYEKAKAELIEIINEMPKSNIRLLDPKKDVEKAIKINEETDGDEYIKSLVSDILDPQTRKNYAIMYLNRIEREFAQSSITTAQEALCLLRLCKNGENIDTTNLDLKTQIAVLAANYCNDVQENHINNILNSAKDEKGEIDLNLCFATLRLLVAGTEAEAPLLEIEIASNAGKKYSKFANYDEIIDTLEKKLQEGELSLTSLL